MGTFRRKRLGFEHRVDDVEDALEGALTAIAALQTSVAGADIGGTFVSPSASNQPYFGGEQIVTTYTMHAADLVSDQFGGQSYGLLLTISGSIANNAQAKTLRLKYGPGPTTIMTLSLPISVAIAYEASIVLTGSHGGGSGLAVAFGTLKLGNGTMAVIPSVIGSQATLPWDITITAQANAYPDFGDAVSSLLVRVPRKTTT